MDAFELIVARVLQSKGLWVGTSHKVELSKCDKRLLNNPSMPRPEIDIVCYCARSNLILAIECKSYLDSRGVAYAELCGEGPDHRYKMFRRPNLRNLVIERLTQQLIAKGQALPGAHCKLGLVAGRVKSGDEPAIRNHFTENGWSFRGPSWIANELQQFANSDYENDIMTVTSKLLLRNQ